MAPESLLFSPLDLRDVRLPNRIVISPMQMYKATDGFAGDWHFQHLAKFAVGGAGTVMTETLCVEPRGRNTHGDLGIWSDEHIAPLQRIVEFLKQQTAVPAAQLAHSGPKAARQRPWEGLGPLKEQDAARGEAPWTPVSATDQPPVAGWHVPHRLTSAEIDEVVHAFGAGARRCHQAGFEVLEVHAAHGYLIHSFLSPVSNDRTDAYGGDRERRMRFALEVAQAVRANWPDGKPLSFRVSCVDRVEGGITIEDTIALATELKGCGVDVIDCSSGGIKGANSLVTLQQQARPALRGFQVPYAGQVRRGADMSTMAVGLILDGPQAERILRSGEADLIAVGREALFDPHWPLHAARALGVDPEWQMWPPSYGWWLRQREATGIADPDDAG